MKSKKFNIILISLKNTIIPIILCSFMIFLILFSTSNIIAAKNGLELWATTVVPSLFPFLFATELLGKTKIVQYLGKTLNKIMRPLFNVPGEGSFAFIMGLISGYPVIDCLHLQIILGLYLLLGLLELVYLLIKVLAYYFLLLILWHVLLLELFSSSLVRMICRIYPIVHINQVSVLLTLSQLYL